MRGPGEILVVSCYELGRQPVAAGLALAELERAGFRPAVLDVSVAPLDPAVLARASLVAIAVPMHTALRLGVRVAAAARALERRPVVAFFGLYAALNAEHLLAHHGEAVIGGESSGPLRALAEEMARGGGPAAEVVDRLGAIPGVATRRQPALDAALRGADRGLVPSRAGLPVLGSYAQLEEPDGTRRLVASVEASRGCLHHCRHCPIVPVYRGRMVALDRAAVLADLAGQVEQGATHVSFGDPDFLNGPTHARKLVEELHERWPALTFDATIKIEHLLRHRALLPALRAAGCTFIISAVESLSDRVLEALDKGHSAADVPVALQLVREAGIELRPTLLPYTPWTALGDLPALFDFAEEHDLVEAIDPVQYTLRLLIPPGSALLDAPGGPGAWLGAFEAESFGWRWTHPDARVDALAAASAACAHQAATSGVPARETFVRLRALADAAAGKSPRPPEAGLPRPRRKVPRLTEPWFC